MSNQSTASSWCLTMVWSNLRWQLEMLLIRPWSMVRNFPKTRWNRCLTILTRFTLDLEQCFCSNIPCKRGFCKRSEKKSIKKQLVRKMVHSIKMKSKSLLNQDSTPRVSQMTSLKWMKLSAKTTPMRRSYKTITQWISTQRKPKSNAWRRKREKPNSSSSRKRRERRLVKNSKSFSKKSSRDQSHWNLSSCKNNKKSRRSRSLERKRDLKLR